MNMSILNALMNYGQKLYAIDIAIGMFIWLDFDRSNSNAGEWKTHIRSVIKIILCRIYWMMKCAIQCVFVHHEFWKFS